MRPRHQGGRLLDWLWRLAVFGSRRGPGWWLRLSPGPIGALAALLRPSAWAQVSAAQRWINPSASVRERLRVFENFAHCLAETLALTPELPIVVERGESTRQLFSDLVGAGSGAVLVTAHGGSWEVVGARLALELGLTERLRFVISDVARAPAGDPRRVGRSEFGIATDRADAGALSGLGLLQAARNGAWLAFQIDRASASGRGLEVTLFGRCFRMPEGPFRIAKLTGLPRLPVFNARVGFLTYQVLAFPPRLLPPNADHAALSEAAQYAADCFQEFLRRHPLQWFHFADVPPPAATTLGASPRRIQTS